MFVLLPESIGRQVLQGPVLVTRNPIIHPSDIRKLKAVRNAKLNDLYKNSLGGCIVFATQGDRSAADEMSGGDFDGDTYLVIFTNDELMDKFQPILEPFDYSIPMEPEPTPKVPVRVPVPPFSSNPSPNPKQTHPNNIYSIPQPIPKTPAKPPSVAVIPSPYYRQPEAPPAMTLTQELNLEDTINAELGYRAPAVKPPVSSAAKMSARSNVEKHSTVDSISFAIMKGT